MAKRRGRSRGYYGKNGGRYKFTAKRKAALKKAQLKSARKRKLAGLAAGVGVIGAVGVAAYLGTRSKGHTSNSRPTTTANAAAKKAVSPSAKETVRTVNAVSTAHPSRTVPAITEADRRMAQAHRDKERKRDSRGPVNIDSTKVTNKQIKSLLRADKDNAVNPDNSIMSPTELDEANKPQRPKPRRGRRRARRGTSTTATTGTKTSSLKGTPGGTKTPQRANQNNRMTEAEITAALGFEETPKVPIDHGPRYPRGAENAIRTAEGSLIYIHPYDSRSGNG